MNIQAYEFYFDFHLKNDLDKKNKNLNFYINYNRKITPTLF